MKQSDAIAILKTGANVFLTGEPGSGKTHTINAYVTWLHERGIEPAITASTGIAATHISGYTIHSWSGIGVKQDLTRYDLDAISQNKRLFNRIRDTHVLIIDEVSMLSASTLSMVDAVCREIRGGGSAFGGMQVVLVGDFFQLPPVERREKRDQESFEEAPSAPFAFRSPAWTALNPIVCYLSEQHRQEDAAFLDLLSAVRRGDVNDDHLELLKERHALKPQPGVTQLYAHNADVDRINTGELGKIAGDAKAFAMTSAGAEKLVAALKKGCLSPETLTLKIGARVMFTRNDVERRFVNGTLGTVSGFSRESGYPIVRTLSGRSVEASPEEWSITDGGRVLAKITQVPLRLSWAMTVHKSQGMSLDAAHMDLSATFEYGQGYVALSRVRTLAGLSLAGINERALEVHPDIRSADGRFRELSDAANERFGRMKENELVTLHRNFVHALGGQWEGGYVAPAAALAPRRSTHDETLSHIAEGASIQKIAAARGLAETTIVGHVADLFSDGKIGRAEVERLLSSQLKRSLPTIHEAFREYGADRLAPVFSRLRGVYSFDELRLARLLYSR